MAEQIDIQAVSGCSCLRARRAARQLSRLYDKELEPVGLTVNQMGLLAKLFGASLHSDNGLPIGALAERMGMHFSTLTRDLKPLIQKRFIAKAAASDDRRIRTVFITKKGQAKLREAVPAWRRAQDHVQGVLGYEVMLSLNALLDLTSAKIAPQSRDVRSARADAQ